MAGAKQEDQIFSIAVASASDITTAFERVQVKRDISFEDALNSVSDFDIMIVAGAPGEDVDAAIANSKETKMLDLISAFALQNVDESCQKWLVSICTGAGFLATCGLFGGKTVTSHWAYLDKLRTICERYSVPPTTVIRERWVNAGVLDGGVKLVTSGGVSCGIDCTLWLVSEIGGANGMDLANGVALMMDYDWKYPRPNITVGQQV